MHWRKLLIIPPLLGGIAVFAWMTPHEKSQRPVATEIATAVRVAEVSPTAFRPSISGYGRVEAATSWTAISEVSGRAVNVDPGLSVGSIVNAGDLLIVIDPRDYQIALAKAEAAREGSRAALRELEAVAANTRTTLELEQRVIALLRTELERQKKLRDRGSVAQAAVDQMTRMVLAQEKIVLDLQNRLNLFPVQREIHAATLATRNAEIEVARRNLERTRLLAPFTGRVSRKSVAMGQFARAGDTLLTIEAIDSAEIVAEFRPVSLRAFMRKFPGGDLSDKVISKNTGDAFDIVTDLNPIVTVHSAHNPAYAWPGKLTRFAGRADERTGALGIVVQVENPNLPDPVSARPPLINGMFVEVRISAREMQHTILVERNALRTDPDGRNFVFIVDRDSRLARRELDVGPVDGKKVIVHSGLAEGDRVVLSDPRPAIYGMLLKPVVK